MGVNINYSGTVAAAREGALYGLPAIAASVQGSHREGYDDAAAFVCRLMEKTAARGLPFGTVLNVNFPDIALNQASGVRFSRQGVDMGGEYIEKRTDPRNRPYFWQGCETPCVNENSDDDGAALSNRFITITPIACDTTDYSLLESLKGWGIDF